MTLSSVKLPIDDYPLAVFASAWSITFAVACALNIDFDHIRIRPGFARAMMKKIFYYQQVILHMKFTYVNDCRPFGWRRTMPRGIIRSQYGAELSSGCLREWLWQCS